jgi:sugar O-acyltransferase (sialic acid O-acetyltransferase NeuD family)
MSQNAMPESILLFGAGGHARSVIGVMLAEGRWKLAGLLDDGPAALSRRVLGYEIIGNREHLVGLREQGISAGLAAIGSNSARGEIAQVMEKAGFALISIVHPSACLMADAVVGPGSFIHAMSVIGPECRIGRNAIIQPFTSLGHESRVGDCVQFSPGVHIGGNVKIGDYCFFGPGAVVYPGVTLGCNVSIGANAVVNKDIGDNVVVAGNPARRVNPALPES